MTPESFAKYWLKAQGVEILTPCPKPETRAVTGKRDAEYVPVTLQYGRE